ncbi:hypothetical protein AAMO2058_001004400 [Amorphochlora amoebiformis]
MTNPPRPRDRSGDTVLDLPLKALLRRGLSFGEAFQATVKAVIGTGVLALPHAFQLSGWAFGPLVLVGIAGYTMYVNLLLTECYSMRPSRPTYSGLCESVLGYSGKLVGGINLIIMQIFVCAAHFVFMGKNLSSALNSWGIGMGLAECVIVCALLTSGFTLLNDITFLKNTSLLGNLAVLISLVSIIVCALPNFNIQNVPLDTTLPDLAVFFSVCIYMFNGIGEVLPISLSMENRQRYPQVLFASFAVLVSSYLCFGLLVSFSFGSATQGLVFDNLSGPVVGVVKLFHAIAVFCTVPLKYFSAINDGLIPLLNSFCGDCVGVQLVLRVGMVVASTIICLTVPDFAFLVALVGGFCIAIVAFILPPLMFQILASNPLNKIPKWRQAVNGTLLATGIVMCTLMTSKNLLDKFATS